MAESSQSSQKPLITKEALKSKLDISHFDLNAVLRGAQLTVVGALTALRNPKLFTSDHYKQAAIAVAAGILIRLAIAVPIWGIRVFLWFLSFGIDMESTTWHNDLLDGLNFIANHVLQVPFFLMSMMRHITPTLDNMFMDSLQWVDYTYNVKHGSEDKSELRDMYYPNLQLYSSRDGSTNTKSTTEAVTTVLMRFVKKAGISLAVFALSYVPYIGRFVLPAASFYTFKKAVGLGPAGVLFGTGIFLPKRYLIIFLQSYFASRSLMRELLEPYFSRIHFTKEQKKRWYHDREGLLFGFAVGFYTFLRIPLLGVLIYGIAEASTAYLITKITSPPPPPAQSAGFTEKEQQWKNKHEFLNLSFDQLDEPEREQQSSSGTSSAIPNEHPSAYRR